MPHVGSELAKVLRGPSGDDRLPANPIWWAWLVVAVMALLPLRVVFTGG